MQNKIAKVSFNKSGGTARGTAITNRITIPTSWIKKMGIDADHREVEISFDGKSITIKKVVNDMEKLEKVCKFINDELKNDNIIGASVEDDTLILDINQSKSYETICEPINYFSIGQMWDDEKNKPFDAFEIDGECFKFDSSERFNAIIYHISLKLA